MKQRRHILEVHTSRLPLADSLDLDSLADLTNGYAGADLASLCNESAYVAMSEHIQEGAQVIKMCRHWPFCLCNILSRKICCFFDVMLCAPSMPKTILRLFS